MKTFKLFIFSGLLLIFLPLAILGQNNGSMPDGIASATRSGDAARLAEYFNPRIELVLPGKSGVFSKEQAQFLMKDFFEQYPPASFQFIHQGERENATFAIGRYHYNRGQYRLLFLVKNSNGQTLIHQLRVEKQDD